MCFKPGDIAEVGKTLVEIEVEGDVEAEASNPAQPASGGQGPSKPAESGGNVKASAKASTSSSKTLASPAVRRVAKEHSVDLSSVRGSGPQGRILKSDVLSFASGGGSAASGGEEAPEGAAGALHGRAPPVDKQVLEVDHWRLREWSAAPVRHRTPPPRRPAPPRPNPARPGPT